LLPAGVLSHFLFDGKSEEDPSREGMMKMVMPGDGGRFHEIKV
jgi:hypothetical protein